MVGVRTIEISKTNIRKAGYNYENGRKEPFFEAGFELIEPVQVEVFGQVFVFEEVVVKLDSISSRLLLDKEKWGREAILEVPSSLCKPIIKSLKQEKRNQPELAEILEHVMNEIHDCDEPESFVDPSKAEFFDQEKIEEALNNEAKKDFSGGEDDTVEKITLTVQEVADLLGVSKPTIYRLVKSNNLPHVKLGGTLFFNREQIVALTRGEVRHHS